MENIFTPYIFFFFGLVLGFFIGFYTQKYIFKKGDKKFGRELGAWCFVVLISILYTASVIADILIIDYSTPLALHGIMGLGAGYILESKIKDILPFIKK